MPGAAATFGHAHAISLRVTTSSRRESIPEPQEELKRPSKGDRHETHRRNRPLRRSHVHHSR
jgi:hypothetical protein